MVAVRAGSRLPAEQRKEQIALVAARLFAEAGFAATTSKDLAKAAGISEALVFKYFSTKDALHEAALAACRQQTVSATVVQRMLGRTPGAAALIDLVRGMAEEIEFLETQPDRDARDTINRMMLRSLCEDGIFARVMLHDLAQHMIRFMTACLEAARAAGELSEMAPQNPQLAAWMGCSLSMGTMAFQLPKPRSEPARGDREAQIDALVRFRLRGLGLTDAVLRKHLPQNAEAVAHAKVSAVEPGRTAMRRRRG